MKPEERDTLAGYIRHAEHFGTEEVFETALDEGLSLRELGWLALRLQNLSKRWRLTLENERLFVLALTRAGTPVSEAARMAGCRAVTARHWVEDAQIDLDEPDVGPELALRRASNQRFENLEGIVRGWRNRR